MSKDVAFFRARLPEFREAEERFFVKKDLSAKEYKGISGRFGSYAQKGGELGMIRLRMCGGRMSKDKLSFIIDECRRFGIAPQPDRGPDLPDHGQGPGPRHQHPGRRRGQPQERVGHVAVRGGARREVRRVPLRQGHGDLPAGHHDGDQDAQEAEGHILQLRQERDPRHVQGPGVHS